MNAQKLWLRLAAFAGVTGLAPALQAAVFSNFDAGNSYSHPFSWTASDIAAGYQELAFPFVPNANGTLSSVNIALGYGITGSSVILTVHADSGGTIGGLLATAPTFTPVIAFNDPASDITSIDFSAAGLALVSGTQYWLDAKATTGSSLGWNQVNNTTGNFEFRNSPAGGYVLTSGKQGGFAVNAAAAPEPASVLSLMVGGVVLLRRRRVRR